MSERIDKLLSQAGAASRKELRALIKSGRVTVNGETVLSPEHKALPADDIRLDGERIITGPVYLMMNKPAGVVSATEDSREKTVIDLLPPSYARLGLFTVGRLDKDTEGLLLLTNDGAWAHRLVSPRSHVDKVYLAHIDIAVNDLDIYSFKSGIVLADGEQCRPAILESLESADGPLVKITISEGKYHQVKRMLASRGAKTLHLERISIGPLDLDPQLPRGQVRELTSEELERLSIGNIDEHEK